MTRKYNLISFTNRDFDPSIKQNFILSKPYDISLRQWLTHPLNPYFLDNTSMAILNLIEVAGQKYQKGTYLNQKVISNKLNIGVSTLRYHLRKLETLGIIYTTNLKKFFPGSIARNGINRHKINPLYASLQDKNYWQVFTNEHPTIVWITCKHERNSYLKNIASSTESSKLNVSINISQAKKLRKENNKRE